MSATRDQSQKVAFVYSNLYQIYQKGKTAAQNAPDCPDAPPVAETPVAVPKSSAVLKAEDLHAQAAGKPAPKVSSYSPAELIGKRISQRVGRPSSLPAAGSAPSGAPRHAIVSLKDNLKALNDLHSRLRFMLQELEDLVRE